MIAVETARYLERCGVRLGHVHVEVNLVGLRGRRGRDARVAEESEALQPGLRIADLFGAVRLLLLHLDLAPDYLVRGFRVAADIDAVDQHFVARIDHEHHVDPLVRVDQLRVRIDVDVRVAAVRVEIRQRQLLPLQARSAEQIPALHRQQLAQFAPRKLQVTFDIDPPDPVRRAFVDRDYDRDFLAAADYLRRRNLHVEVAVVVVKSRQPIDVFLKFPLIERAPSRDPAQQLAVGPRRHVGLQSRRRKRVVADEFDLRDLDLRPFHHVEFAERRIVGLRDRLETYLGVGVARVRINLRDVVD